MLKINQNLQMFGLQLNTYEVVGRGSETQFQVCENLKFLI